MTVPAAAAARGVREAGQRPDPQISAIANGIGAVRQICDDFNDCFPEYHEPFADGLNRLPELLFRVDGGRRHHVLRLLREGHDDEARACVLNPRVRERLHRYCRERIDQMERIRAPFDFTELIDDIELILTR